MLRNKEIRYFLLFYVIATVCTAGVSFWLRSAAGVLLLVFSGICGVAFFRVTAYRYRKLADISEEIDRVLHKEEHIFQTMEEEGELSILESEIIKMTVRIREQNQTLQREREFLADSLADIAHQLRTPLTSANLMLSLMEKQTDPAELRNMLHETEQLFVQMEWLINSLLKISRLDAGMSVLKKEPVSVSELIRQALHPFLITMDLHEIEVTCRIAPEITIEADREWMSEAIQNILKNCIQSIGAHGRIEIACEDTLLYTKIIMHDSGKGFSVEDLPHIFERFYRGKGDSASGYGIGLALSKMICVRSGAALTAENHVLGGAVFQICFSK